MSTDTEAVTTDTETVTAVKKPRLTDLDRKNLRVARAEKKLARVKAVGTKVIARAARLAEAQAKSQRKADAVQADIALAEAVVQHEKTRPVRGEVLTETDLDVEDEFDEDDLDEDDADDEDDDEDDADVEVSKDDETLF